MNITKQHLCKMVSKDMGGDASPIYTKSLIDTLIVNILKVIASGKNIEIRGFGSFKSKVRKKKRARNPRSGEFLEIPEYTTLVFKISKEGQKNFENLLKTYRRP